MDGNDDAGKSYWSVYRSACRRTRQDVLDLLATNQCSSIQAVDENVEHHSGDDNHVHSESNHSVCNTTVSDEAVNDDTMLFDSYDDLSQSFSSSFQDFDSDSDSLSSVSDSDCNDYASTKDDLAQWCLEFNISHVAINKLLKIFKPLCPSLPTDARTLLQTPRYVPVKECGEGQYVHLGLEKGIRKALCCCDIDQVEEIHLQINIDGLPLYKSSNVQFWPILCLIKQPLTTDPFAVGVYSGAGKPPVGFLSEFVEEFKLLMCTGLLVGVNQLRVKLHSFVCDAPARSFVKCVKSHSGYSSCEKCDQHGDWAGKVVFTCVSGNLRTDEQFSNKVDEDHHLPGKISPLTSLPVGMVSQFPLDPMHLLYLGVMRRLLLLWLRGPLTVRLSSPTVQELSASLLMLGPHIPRDFCRRPRSLTEIDRWKATEFRLFLLYCGPVVLRKTLREPLYNHFMLLFVASTILTSKRLCLQYHGYAGDLLKLFVKGMTELYGRDHIVYNIHGLIHLASDVERFGNLENFSSFPFENKLKNIKKLVRKPHIPLQQVALRLGEHEHFIPELVKTDERPYIFCHEHNKGHVPETLRGVKQFRKLSRNGVILSSDERDSCVELMDKSVVVIQNILEVDKKALIVYKRFKKTVPFFNYPLSSTSLGIYNVAELQTTHAVTDFENITQKFMLLPFALGQETREMFFVVEFVNGSVEVVPDNWINGDGKFCYWPKFSKDKMFRAIQKKTEPDDNWERSDIKRVMRKCATFAIATKKAEKAVETSDLSTTDADVEPLTGREDGRRIVRRPLAFSPVPDRVTAKRAKFDIHSKVDKSSMPSVLNELPPVPCGLAEQNSDEENVIGHMLDSQHSNTQGCNIGTSSTISTTLHCQNDFLTTDRDSMGNRSKKNLGHEMQVGHERPDSVFSQNSIIATDLEQTSISQFDPHQGTGNLISDEQSNQNTLSASYGSSRVHSNVARSASLDRSQKERSCLAPNIQQGSVDPIFNGQSGKTSLSKSKRSTAVRGSEHGQTEEIQLCLSTPVHNSKNQPSRTSIDQCSPRALNSSSLSRTKSPVRWSSTSRSVTTPLVAGDQAEDTLLHKQFRLIISKLNRMDEKLDSLSRRLHVAHNRGGNSGSVDVPTKPNGINLPADTMKDLKHMSSIVLQDERLRKSLVQYLATFGSTTLTDTVCGIMKALMTNTLSLQFNWIGSRGKQSFDKLQMSTFICDAVRMNSPTASSTNRMIQDKIKSWLRQSRDRDGGRKRRYLASASRHIQRSSPKKLKNVMDMPTDNEDNVEQSDDN